MATEDKARVFGLYIGSMCQRFLVSYNAPLGKYDKVQLDYINFRNLVDGNGLWYYKLILRPLSDISDEDARTVCKLLNIHCPQEAELTKHKGESFYQPKDTTRNGCA